MPELPEPNAKAVLYEVSLLPEDHIDYRPFVVTVEERGGQWAVVHGDRCLGADGAWVRGVKPHGRGDAWLATHRFDLDTALRLAREAAPYVDVNGTTASSAYQRAVGPQRPIGRPDAEIVEFGDARLSAGFWERVRPDASGCWMWALKPTTNGYCRYRVRGERYMAHRFAYEALVGPIPHGLQLDHVCHSFDATCTGGPTCLHKRCVNPAHLEPVTGRENTLRFVDFNREARCPKGHPYDVVNIRFTSKGLRYCAACIQLRNATAK